jgi:hypothetical protein
MSNNIVDFAHQIIDMQQELEFLRRENRDLRRIQDEYDQFMRSSLKHNTNMLGKLLQVCVTTDLTPKMKND